MNKHFQGCLMIDIGFGERKRSANKTPQSLSQCVVPSFNMGCFACFFTNRLMRLAQQTKYLFIRFPKVAERGTMPVSCWYPRPQTPTAFFTAVANEVGHNLACSTVQGYPNPSFVFFDSTNDHNSSISSTSSGCASFNGGISGNESAFSLSHLATVWRATPNVRSMPRKLERSW
jgi:hypothetical protein